MKTLFAAVTILSAFALFADGEININGKFQPDPQKKDFPHTWYSQHTALKNEQGKVQVTLSEPDENGVRVLTVVTSPDFKKEDKSRWKNFCIYTTNVKDMQTVKGDEFIITAEIAGEGNAYFGLLGYGTPSTYKTTKITREFQKVSLNWTTKVVKNASGKASYRVFFEFTPGSSIKIRNVKLFKKSAPAETKTEAPAK